MFGTVNYWIALATLAAGLVLGYLLANSPLLRAPTPPPEVPKEITLPADAVQVQACANNKGTLYTKPADIPLGPVYMVRNGKVIGIEFMLNKDEFLGGQSYKFLSVLGMKIDHFNLGLLSQGHEGNPVPHYHLDLYNVGKDVEQAIKCP